MALTSNNNLKKKVTSNKIIKQKEINMSNLAQRVAAWVKKRIASGAKKIVWAEAQRLSNRQAIKASRKQTKKNTQLIWIQRAKKLYKERTWKTMTASRLKTELQGGLLSRDTKQYLKDRKSFTKETQKRFKVK